jgi:hypothetical protein
MADVPYPPRGATYPCSDARAEGVAVAKGDLRAVGEVPLIAKLVLFHELSAPRHRIRNHARS